MEDLVLLAKNLNFDSQLLKNCSINLLTIDDINVAMNLKSDWKLDVKITMEYDILYDKLYLGPYFEVPEHYKRMFLVLSFLKAVPVLKTGNKTLQDYTEALRVLDVAIMIGSGLKECDLVTEFTQKLHDLVVGIHPIDPVDPLSQSQFETSQNSCDIKSSECPSIENFMTNFFNFHQPVRITNSFSHWLATTKWKDMNYFTKLAGYRTVPIELGRTYDDDNWGQNMMQFSEFIKQYMNDNDHPQKGYLAQHDLFDQIPILMDDFVAPDYCAIGNYPAIIKSWIGPKNTISTMHTDDKHNFLCQVIGEKLVILASPDNTENLYPYKGLMNNTTQVDVENLDFEKYPKVKDVKFQRVVLKAGDMLYIPKLYWHYVRSLTPSISISFWFDCE